MTDERTGVIIGQMLADYEVELKDQGFVPTEKFAQAQEAITLAKELAEMNDGKVQLSYRMTRLDIIIEAYVFNVIVQDMPKFKDLVDKCDLLDAHVGVRPKDGEFVRFEFGINNVFKPA